MRRPLIALLALTAAAGCGAANAGPAAKPRTGLIVPGRSIDRIQLGMSEARVRSIYGKPDHISYPILEGDGRLTDYRYHGRDLLAEFFHGKLIAVFAFSRRQRTRGGSGVGTTERALVTDLDGIDCQPEDSLRWCTLEQGRIQTIFQIKHGRVERVWVIDTANG